MIFLYFFLSPLLSISPPLLSLSLSLSLSFLLTYLLLRTVENRTRLLRRTGPFCRVGVIGVRPAWIMQNSLRVPVQMFFRLKPIVRFLDKGNKNEQCFRPRFCTCMAILGRGQPGLMNWCLLWIMPQVQDRSLYLLTSSQAPYHNTTDAPGYGNNYNLNITEQKH